MAMARATLAVLAFLLASAYGKATFCKNLDCPNFTVVNSTDSWELRSVEAAKWVATNGTAFNKDDINTSMFFKLFAYISGANAKATKIAMTAPVLTTVFPGPGPNCESDFIMHFMLPHEHWASPIQPTDPRVYIVDTPAMDVYVKSFGGYARDADYVEKVQELSKELSTANYNVQDSFFFEAGYDGPYTFTGRHNEVWIVKQ